ncbi:MAG: glucose-6-phosphate isomerase [Chloroflexus sp.]
MTYEDANWRARQRIRLDINNVFGPQGLTPAELEAAAPQAAAAIAAVQSRREALGWPLLPDQDVTPFEQFAAQHRDRIDTFVVLGIGGSALGNIAVQTAINGPFYNLLPREQRGWPRLLVLDNSDPELNASALRMLDLRRTMFNVISKSGTTAETMASFLYFRQALVETIGEERLSEHIVLTTDPSSGFLRQIGQREGWTMFDLPPKVGGRFSVLTAVGLLSAAMTGVNLRELLAGAAYGGELAAIPDPLRNPAALGALVNVLCFQKGKPIIVMMPYANRLRDIADWFAQLWAESLGKAVDREGKPARVGQTPVKALGATDQHSQVQLYMEGPYDKLINFIAVERYADDAPIPTAYPDLEGVSYLGGHTMAELIQAEQQATAIALSEAGQPNMTHIFPEINAFTLGQFIMLMEMQTAIAGELYNINAFDQPGVEAGKINTYALLGRRGFEERRAAIAARAQTLDPRWVV